MIRVYIACSLDGFIAGPDDDLSWLPQSEPDAASVEPGAVQFGEFMAGVGAMLMGRRTYDVVAGMDCEWPYGDTPVFVLTNRPLESPAAPTVRAAPGASVAEAAAAAKAAAGERDVYVDGGSVVRQALDAGLVESLILTLVPTVLGGGQALFAGAQRAELEFTGSYKLGDMVQLHAVPRSSG